ncbi:MAG TPA: penicillin-binding transpeptidase domain-containing protein [Candidatus Kapabacteria bacterium]|nr:penicillin-binding transpeptidase domain-containing protein [Candidatus Kapabacteria bacterium]HPO62809.1 penicillin-binding transpeptidase domain-containing protein [Candidatus Kapabacteria bacterium]
MIEDFKQNSTIRKKLWKFLLLFSLINIAILIIIVKLFSIQIIETDEYKKIAQNQHETKVYLNPERGNIYDREGKLLATTIQTISLAVDPIVLKDETEQMELCLQIERATSIPANQLIEKIRKSSGSFVWLARGLKYNEINGLDTINVNGFIKKIEPRRIYLYGECAAQLIGCVNVDNKGITGVELAYDTLLKGKSGFMKMYRDAQRRLRPSPDLPEVPPQNGKSIKLTIDIDLQQIVEYELMNTVMSSNAQSGTVAAIDVKTGEILAMASYPSFNPNNIQNVQPANMRNLAITDVFEPGSTFKVVTASAVLQEGLLQPDDIVKGNNGMLQIGDYKIIDGHPFSQATFKQAVEYSSNIVFSNLANSLTNSKLFGYIHFFGFGSKTGIDIQGEVSGISKSIKNYNSITKRFLGFGYGISVTPLQLLNCYSTIANNGVMNKPFVVKEILNAKNEVLDSNKTKKIRQIISSQTAKTLTDLLVNVVEQGTGIKAKVNNLKIAGKTGTAQQYAGTQYSKQNYTSSFAGFFPADTPTVAMVVLLDKPQGEYYGGAVAAPLFKRIVQGWMIAKPKLFKTNKTNFPVELQSYPVASQNFQKDSVIMLSNDSLPNVRGLSLRKAIAILQNKGFETEIIGKGIVTEQKWKKKENKFVCVLNCNN